MFDRRFLAEAAALIAAAVLCAAVANVVADRERKLAWVGDYPNARTIPQSTGGERVAAPAPAVLESEPAPGPAAPPLTTTVPSTTTAAQPTQTTTAAQQPAPARPVAPKYSLADFPSTPDSPSDEISPDQAIALWQLKVPFLDARRSDVYRQGHIAGARSFPVWESDIDARVTAFYEEGHDQEKPVVLYCSGGACEDSHMLAQKLWGLGFNNVLIYTEGWPDWAKRGLPARQGDQP